MPTPISTKTDVTETKKQSMVIDAFAFFMALHTALIKNESEALQCVIRGPANEKEIADSKAFNLALWQSDAQYRQEYRRTAVNVIKLLEDMGIRIRCADIGMLTDTLDYLRTIPSRDAYDLEEMVTAGEEPAAK
jgi:hypothetical protein